MSPSMGMILFLKLLNLEFRKVVHTADNVITATYADYNAILSSNESSVNASAMLQIESFQLKNGCKSAMWNVTFTLKKR